MEACCDLEVDVNGEETFMVDKNIVASHSGRFCKLFGKPKATTTTTKSTPRTRLKVVFHDFPGGPECFELMLRFCHNFGRTQITPSNITLLHCVAKFMEMNNLLEQTEKGFEEMRYWSWSELLIAAKQSQSLCPGPGSSEGLERCLDCLVARLGSPAAEASPCPSTSSPDSSGFRFSCDTKSTESLKTAFSRTTWWFEDLLFLSPATVQSLVKSMIARKFDHAIISKFLFYYHKSKFHTAAASGEKSRVFETVVDSLCALDQSCVPCKSLFEINRVATSSKTSKIARSKLESMIGSSLDQAALDNLLVPSPHGTDYLYDVNLVLRFLKAFLRGRSAKVPATGLNKVASLLDLYTVEVAPDPCLKPSKFLALITALPESARDSYDEVYRAIDMYLEVHTGLSEEEKTRICSAMSYEKLSSEACLNLSRNKKFPPESVVQALIAQQFRLKSLLKSTASENGDEATKTEPNEEEEQVVLYAGQLDLRPGNASLRSHLQGMQWRVMELEKVRKKMQVQMAKIMKSRPTTTSQTHTRSLPRLCS